MNKKTKGFTLVELIVVVAVLAMLAVGAVVAIGGIQGRARVAANRAAAVSMAETFNNFVAAGGDPTTVPANNHTAATWTGTVAIGGENMTFSVALSTTARWNQVRGWVLPAVGAAGVVFTDDPGADFTVAPM